MAKKTVDYESLRADIEVGRLAPVYLLHGEETYFIDELTELLLNTVLTEEEKDFNLTQMYGADVQNLGDVIAACRRFPMMAERQMVLLREAQMLDQRRSLLQFDQLELYLQQPLESTVFVITYSGKKIDSRLKWVKMVETCGGVVFESKRFRDYELPKVLSGYLSRTGLRFDADAQQLLIDYVGSDLAQMMAEIEKLKVSVAGGHVTKGDVAEHIGISKEYNNYELISAVAQRDFRKCEMIRRYFVQNAKKNPIQLTLSVLFNFFTNIMLAHYSPDKTVNGLMASLSLSYPQAKEIAPALRIYNGWKAMQNIALIREYDARLKGARGETLPDSEALQELLYKLMH